jgi:hypothetical protein
MGEDASELDDAGDRSQLVVPSDVPALAGVRYLHGCFPEAFLQELDVVRLETEVSTSSQNMFANRRFLRSDELAAKVLSYLPSSLGFTRILSDMRFIEYPPGGHILPHVDGVRVDAETLESSTHSMLLFTSDVPEGEGGETEFLDGLEGKNGGAEENDVLFAARPSRGSVLLFPHDAPHRGACVGLHPKILLRGDLY